MDFAEIFIVIAIIFAVVLTGIGSNFSNNFNDITQHYLPVIPSPLPEQKTIQIKNIQFSPIPPTPTSPGTGGNPGGNPIATGGKASPTCPLAVPIDYPTVINRLRSSYGIHVDGPALTLGRAKQAFKTMCMLFQSAKYQSVLNSVRSPVTIHYVANSGNYGLTGDGLQTMIYNGAQGLEDQYLILHEFTHVIQKGGGQGRDSAILHDWQRQVWNPNNPRIPNSWPCDTEEDGSGGECQAESVALYVMYPNTWYPSFPRNFPKYYSWVGSRVFGGVYFYSKPQ